MIRKILAACSCACAVLIGSGCLFNSKEVSVSFSDSLEQQREYYRNELINHDGLALESENFLRGNLMQDDLTSDPMQILRKLDEYHKLSGNPKFFVIAADLCRYLATQTKETEAMQYNLASFYYATTYVRYQSTHLANEEKLDYDFSAPQSLQNYNEACSAIFSYLKKRNLLDSSAFMLTDKEGRKYIMEKPVFNLSVPREAIEDFSLCASYTIKDLMQINRQPGIGVPLVATIKTQQWYKSLKTPKGLTIPVTLLLERREKASGEITLRLIFIDTSKQERLRFAGNAIKNMKLHLALDFSTPLACYLNSLSERNLLAQMLSPFEQEASDGLYMIEPYQPDKIPVVFIHGLMSSPETWMQMINSLKNNPTIRSRYQFWFFYYSTGVPVPFNAKKLRNSLLAAQKEFCTTPERTDNFNKMVLIGHSMGGMLTRMMLQKDPYYMAETLFQMPWNKIKEKLQPEDFKELDSVIPYTLPFVHRAIFMAVPHRGAEMAQSPIAQLGIYLIKLPASLLKKEDAFKRITRTLHPDLSGTKMRSKFFTGIDNLDPDNDFVRMLGNSVMKDDLTFHCVIGNIDEAGVPDKSDGVVPYWSSHLDNAASELIVKSNHSVHRRPAAIQEVLRILLLHLESVDAAKK